MDASAVHGTDGFFLISRQKNLKKLKSNNSNVNVLKVIMMQNLLFWQKTVSIKPYGAHYVVKPGIFLFS